MRVKSSALARVLVGLGLLLALAGPAGAQNNKQAQFDEAWNRGQDAFNLGKYDEARAQFEKARDLDPKKPGPWRWLGKIAKVQARYEDCLNATSEAIKLAPDSPNAPEVRKDLDECRSTLGKPALRVDLAQGQGALSVTANVEGAQVSVDGIRKGATPLDPVALQAGKVTIRLEKEGFFPIDVEAEIVRTIVVDVYVTLEADPDYKPKDTGGDTGPGVDTKVGWIVVAVDATDGVTLALDGKPVTPTADGTIEATPGLHLLEVTAAGREPWRRRVRVARGQRRPIAVKMQSTSEKQGKDRMGYVFFGVAAAAGVTGAVFGFLENDAAEQAEDAYRLEQYRGQDGLDPGEVMGVPEAEITTRAEYDELKDKAAGYALISNVAYGVGVVALGVSVYYFVSARAPERPGYPAPLARRKPGRRLEPVVLGKGQGGGLVFTQELNW